jgi:hypothetical protein
LHVGERVGSNCPVSWSNSDSLTSRLHLRDASFCIENYRHGGPLRASMEDAHRKKSVLAYPSFGSRPFVKPIASATVQFSFPDAKGTRSVGKESLWPPRLTRGFYRFFHDSGRMLVSKQIRNSITESTATFDILDILSLLAQETTIQLTPSS